MPFDPPNFNALPTEANITITSDLGVIGSMTISNQSGIDYEYAAYQDFVQQMMDVLSQVPGTSIMQATLQYGSQAAITPSQNPELVLNFREPGLSVKNEQVERRS